MTEGKSKFKRRMEKQSDYYFIEHWEEGKRPFNWFAQWSPLNIRIYELEIGDRFEVCESAWGSGEDLAEDRQPNDNSNQDRAVLIDFAREDRRSAHVEETDEDREKRRQRTNVFNKRFRVATTPHTRFILGKCSLEDDRSIGLIEDGEEPPLLGGFFQGSGKGRVTIHPAEGQYLGHFGFINQTDLQWDRTGALQLDDLWFEFYMPEKIFEGLVERIQQIGSGATSYAHMKVLAFQSEVEKSLAEPYHRQTYYVAKQEYSTTGSAVLESVNVVTPRPIGSMPTSGFKDHTNANNLEIANEDDWLDEKPAPINQSQQPVQIISPPQRPARLWPVALGLWAVFFGLLLNAFPR